MQQRDATMVKSYNNPVENEKPICTREGCFVVLPSSFVANGYKYCSESCLLQGLMEQPSDLFDDPSEADEKED